MLISKRFSKALLYCFISYYNVFRCVLTWTYVNCQAILRLKSILNALKKLSLCQVPTNNVSYNDPVYRVCKANNDFCNDLGIILYKHLQEKFEYVGYLNVEFYNINIVNINTYVCYYFNDYYFCM